MTLSRVSGGLSIVALLAVWLAAATVGNRRSYDAPASHSAVTARMELVSSGLTVETTHLGDHRYPAIVRPSRNPFQFRSRPAPVMRPARVAEVVSPAISEPPAPPRPELKLAGIAEDPSGGGPVRTAVISGMGQVFLVKEGDQVTARFRVARIAADAVELIDSSDGSSWRLALR
jgi:hypothetical protein